MNPAHPPFLGELELAVMDHLWSSGAKDAKAVHRAVGRGRRITLNTIQSTLKRLFEKGLLQRKKESHAHIYSPRVTRAEFHRKALQEVIGMGVPAEAARDLWELIERGVENGAVLDLRNA